MKKTDELFFKTIKIDISFGEKIKKNTKEQILMCFDAAADKNFPVNFD